MNLEPLTNTSIAIQLHVVAAVLAFVLGLLQIFLRKGTALHKTAGWVWIWMMAAVALSSFFIHTIQLVGPWSPIHLLSVYTLIMLWWGVRQGQRGRLREHGITMASLFVFALVGAGAFTLLPGRMMHTVVFG
ncbi:DUF2306 domain-containing protein [Marinobacter sp.]|uniref:DUF2306 domain-containing protein n=1 Tax=Marinobacter sp. TaxID=50741 RepID=UPI003566B452